MKKILLLCLSAFMLSTALLIPCEKVAAAEVKLVFNSRQALLMENSTGKILFEKNSEEARPIASMVKIMTLLCIYDAVDCGKITLQDDVTVSQNAASMGGSQVFLSANSVHKADDLIKTIIICSANDSCVAMAEHICGSVDVFVDEMNKKGAELGLINTNFVNCTGLPAVNQFSCAKDVGSMMRELLTHEEYFVHAKVWLEDYIHPDGRKTTITNTNKLSRFYDGCDGGKTGFTQEALHCLCATAVRDGTRYIAVVVGAPDSKTRFAEVSNMFNYAFANYGCHIFAKINEPIGEIAVKGGKLDVVGVVPTTELSYLYQKGGKQPEMKLEIAQNVTAPCEVGDIVGKAYLVLDGEVVSQADLTVCQSVAKKTYFDYIKDILGIG